MRKYCCIVGNTRKLIDNFISNNLSNHENYSIVKLSTSKKDWIYDITGCKFDRIIIIPDTNISNMSISYLMAKLNNSDLDLLIEVDI